MPHKDLGAAIAANCLRRLVTIAAALALAATSPESTLAEVGNQRCLFTSQGKTGLVDIETGEVRYLDFQAPNQVTWQPGPCFADGRRLVVLSMEPRRDEPGRPFEEFYTQTPTHLWMHHLTSGNLEEICNKERPATFMTPQLLIGDDRLLIQVVREKVGQILSVRLDGTDAK